MGGNHEKMVGNKKIALSFLGSMRPSFCIFISLLFFRVFNQSFCTLFCFKCFYLCIMLVVFKVNNKSMALFFHTVLCLLNYVPFLDVSFFNNFSAIFSVRRRSNYCEFV